MKSAICRNLNWVTLSLVWIFALLNPVFKKYDYGAGYPVLIVFAVLLGFWAFKLRNTKREEALFEELSLISFCVFVVISFATSQMRTQGFSEVLAFLSMSTFYLLFALRKIDWTDKILRVVMLGGLGSLLVGYLAYIVWPEPRMMGPFFSFLYHAHHWPNAFALFLLMLWPVFTFSDLKPIFGDKYGGRLFVRVTVLSLIVAALMLTYSRGAMIAFIGQLGLMGLIFWKEVRWKLIIKVCLVAITSLFIFIGANMLREENHAVVDLEKRANFENQESLTSVTERKDFWQGAIQISQEKPWYGTGPFSFRQAYNPLQKNFLANADHPHNLFLKIAAENGYLALLAFILFILAFSDKLLRRALKLKKKDKIVVGSLFVALSGAIAHNLIDYNFNFVANLLLFFIFLVIIRSKLVKKENSEQRQYSVFFIAAIITVVAFIEALILVGGEIGDDEELRYSFFPRAYYLTNADEDISNGNYSRALALLEKELSLSPLSDRGYYLRGVIHCDSNSEYFDSDACKTNAAMALGLNDQNHWDYYILYLQAFENELPEEFIEMTKNRLSEYFVFVEQNVHFTAYTDNVEKAAAVVELLSLQLDDTAAQSFLKQKEKMLEEASRIRGEKTY